MGDIRTRKINQKHLNDIKMEEKIIYFMCLLMDLSILYEITEIYCIILLSLPSWERGLKYCITWIRARSQTVAPFVGAWIEIAWLHLAAKQSVRRSLRESVDCNKIDQTVEIDFCIDFFVKM